MLQPGLCGGLTLQKEVMLPATIKSKSLQELGDEDGGEPAYDSYLVTTVQRLRRKPLNEYTVEDLRIMIGQQIGLSYLIPLAVERLADHPLASGDYYNGDLLKMVLSVDIGYWTQHQKQWRDVEEIVAGLETMKEKIENDLWSAAEKFKQTGGSF
jgi:hypothetical protein